MLLPSARDCADAVSPIGNSTNAYMVLALNQIATALTSGNRTCTLTVSGKTAADVQVVKQQLLNLGYRLTQTTTTITILWDGTVPAVAINY